MTWIVLTILLMIVGTVGFGLLVYARAMARAQAEALAAVPDQAREREARYRIGLEDRPVGAVRLVGWGLLGGSVFVWLLVTGFAMLHNVGQREVAIVYNFSGTISGKRDPGTVVIKPWEHIKKENVGIQHNEWAFGEGNSAVSADQQPVYARLAVNYNIDGANVVDLYKRVGAAWKTIIVDSRVPQVFKEVTSAMATPSITGQREKLRSNTREKLQAELAPYDIQVVDVFITNLGFSDSYTASIEAKQKQVQDALRAQAKVSEVEAQARQKVAAAKGDADANVARARGEATANRLRQRSLTPLLVQLQAIETLNPNVQTIVCPPNAVCIPNSPVVPNPGGAP